METVYTLFTKLQLWIDCAASLLSSKSVIFHKKFIKSGTLFDVNSPSSATGFHQSCNHVTNKNLRRPVKRIRWC